MHGFLTKPWVVERGSYLTSLLSIVQKQLDGDSVKVNEIIYLIIVPTMV